MDRRVGRAGAKNLALKCGVDLAVERSVKASRATQSELINRVYF
jgi:hypothetical protein